MKSKGIVFANDRHLEEIPLENLKGADLAGAAGGRDASSSLHFTRTTRLHKDSTATQGWQVVVLSLWRCVVRVKCKLEEASRPPAVPARSAPIPLDFSSKSIPSSISLQILLESQGDPLRLL